MANGILANSATIMNLSGEGLPTPPKIINEKAHAMNAHLRNATLFAVIVSALVFAWAADPPPPSTTEPTLKGLESAEPRDVAPPGDRWALLIGINAYEHMSHLQFCARDMEVLRDDLVSHAGYAPEHVRLLCDTSPGGDADHAKGDADRDKGSQHIKFQPTRNNILLALREFLSQAKEGDSVLVAFSGHGHQEEGNSYLIPIDGSMELPDDTMLSIKNHLQKALDKCPARQKVVILDACHSGGKGGDEPITQFDPGAVTTGKGTVQLVSCAVNQISIEDSKLEQGLFSYYLAKGIEGAADDEVAGNHDGYVSVDELYAYVYEKVKTRAQEKHKRQQFPQKSGQGEGTIILGSRHVDERDRGLPSEQLHSWLTSAAKRQQVLPAFADEAQGWLGVDNAFEPAERLRLFLSLRSRGAISQQQFDLLADSSIRQVRSHLAAREAAKQGKLRVLSIGINRYGGGHDLAFAVSDARHISESITKTSALAVDRSAILENDAATPDSVREKVEAMLLASTEKDLVVVFFAGQGYRDRPDQDKPERTGWILNNETLLNAAFSPDATKVLTASSDGTARLWDAASGTPLGEPLRHDRQVQALAFSPDGTKVMTGSFDGTVRLWDAATGKPLGEPLRHEGGVIAVAFSPSGVKVLTGGGSSKHGTAQLWDSATRKPFGEPLRHDYAVFAVAFSPDGTKVLTGSIDKTARLWDASTGKPLGEPLRHDNAVLAVAFSPDGNTVLTGSGDKTARHWDAKTGKQLGEPLQHDGEVIAVAFSPDGNTVLTGSGDKTARRWDATTGKQIGEPLRHDGVVFAVAFSPDGTKMLTGSDDKTARSWDAATGKALGKPIRIGTVAVPPNTDAAVEHRGLEPSSDDDLAKFDAYPTNVLPTAQLEKWMKDAKTNVLFVCDTCYVRPADLAVLTAKSEGELTKLLISVPGEALEDAAVKHGLLTSLVVEGLSGAADRETPAFFSDAKNPTRLESGQSDGFVTARELVKFVAQHHGLSLSQGKRIQEVGIFGELGKRDIVITAPALVK